jgi:ankyrin repeat protein
VATWGSSGCYLEQNADVNAAPAEWDGGTALQAASGRGHLEVVRLLLERSFEVNAVPGKWDGRTAIQAASKVGHLEMVGCC